MAKNRAQLTEEATSLGIDYSTFETNAQFVAAINEAKPLGGSATFETPKVKEDRSVYNCVACKGEGLVNPEHPLTTLCPVCGGTGKA